MALRNAFLVETRSSSLRSGSVADRSPASMLEPARRSAAVSTSNPSGSTP